MKRVEILTANNIAIQYETATLTSRGVALFIDFITIAIYSGIMSFLIGMIALGSFTNNGSNSFVTVLFYTVVYLPVLFYSLIMEFFLKGQTLGKLVVGIRTTSLNGENAKLNDLTMRWLFRVVDFWMSMGGIGALFITTTDNAQRLGDVLAQTIVIKKNPDQKYNIHDILSIKNKSTHETTYSSVTQFTDEDMILIKNAISRVKKHTNDTHKQFIRDLADKVAEKLNLDETPKRKLTFLNTVLQDYIILTR